ncbi:MAG: DNA-processing protein DprA, partial [Clostridiaceae bacterium]
MRQLSAEEQNRLWLHYAVEFNARLFLRIQERFSSLTQAREAFEAKNPLFDSLSEKVRQRLSEAAAQGFIERYTEKLEKKRISFTYPGEEHYPKLLAEIGDPPSVLYYKGTLAAEPGLAIAIVGSRHPSPYGIETAKRFAFSLAESGAQIVSGMAEGIDACVARGALESKSSVCPTVAVLGCGVDVIYPNANKQLYEEIIERGAVVSEFLPGARAERFHFPIRNRVMSGMAHGTLVVEAAER